ncbi:ATP-binding protein [Streptosporangium sp. CA-115845]|uniref:ATP-binding protein n=1 Tax=Streptosporangium sp. CA-115845 TaxID=3240071 RepID=UPI003D93EA4B
MGRVSALTQPFDEYGKPLGRFRMTAWCLPPDNAARRARELFRDQLAKQLMDPDVLDDLEIVISELVTNATRYAPAPYELRLLHDHGLPVRAEVVDAGAGTTLIHHLLHRPPTIPEHLDDLEPDGRGLHIVTNSPTATAAPNGPACAAPDNSAPPSGSTSPPGHTNPELPRPPGRRDRPPIPLTPEPVHADGSPVPSVGRTKRPASADPIPPLSGTPAFLLPPRRKAPVLMVVPANEPLRPRGRRRRGAAPVPDLPTPGPATSTDNTTDLAHDLEARHLGWVILWRRWARRYWAFPTWLPNAPGPIEARNVQDLLAQMNDVYDQGGKGPS